MTNSKLSALTDITTLAGTDIFYAVRPGSPDADYKATATEILAYAAANLSSATFSQTGLAVKGASANALTLKPNETLSAARILNLKVNNADRTIDLSGNLTVSSAATISGTNTGDQTLGGLGAAASGANTDISSVLLNQTGLVVKGASSNALTIKPNETLSAARILNLIVNNADRTIDLSGNLTVSSAATLSGTNTGDQTLSSLGLANSTTDNTLVRFDSTAGHTQSSGIVVSDANEISGFLALVVNDANTTRTLASTDTGTTLRFTSNSAVTVTLPNNMTVGFTVEVIQAGTAQVTLSAAGGATINNRSSQTKTAGQHAAVRLVVTANSGGAAAVYNLAGDTGA